MCCSSRKKLIKSQKLIVFINIVRNGEGCQCPLSREACLLLTAGNLVLSELLFKGCTNGVLSVKTDTRTGNCLLWTFAPFVMLEFIQKNMQLHIDIREN